MLHAPRVLRPIPAASTPAPGPLDARADRVVSRALPAATALLCLGMLASWLPHYLTWPWWPDLDTLGAMAAAWRAGIRPYRDLVGYNFPGQIYLCLGLDAIFGPGRTWPFYLADGSMVVTLGLALGLWSRRRFGRLWPGLVGYAAFLAYYLNLNFALVAQRDWQTAFFAVLGLLAPSTFPGRTGRTVSAVAVALGLAFRPHVVLFGPALLLAVVEGDREAGRDRRPIVPVLAWLATAAVAALLVYAPLIAQGILDDLVRNIRLASYGSRYSRATPLGMLGGIVRPLIEFRWSVVPAAVGLLAMTGVGPIRREARVWLLAAAGALLYKPLHPFPHDYLDEPRWVVWSVLLALVAAAVAAAPGLRGRYRLAAALAVLAAAVPAKPAYCNAGVAVRCVLAAARGTPVPEPPGYRHHGAIYEVARYPWPDFDAAVDYLRDDLGPRTRVANLLGFQLGAVGAAGRVPVFRNESGLLWKSLVGWDEQHFIDQLESEPDSVVIWSPTVEGPEPGLISPGLDAVVRRLYEPAATFGVVEVWRRKAGR